MRTWVHVAASAIISALLHPFFGWIGAIMIMAGGVLIDIDHYFSYIMRYKKWNIQECYRFYSRQVDAVDFSENEGILLIFHTIEFLSLAIFLSFYFTAALAFLAGLSIHSVLDLIYLWRVPKKFVANHSAIIWLILNSKNKRV